MDKSISRQIAEYAVGLKFENLPEDVIYEVKRYMYDSIGCAYGGYHTRDVNIIRDIYWKWVAKVNPLFLDLAISYRLSMPR